jgi:hypothetical protein
LSRQYDDGQRSGVGDIVGKIGDLAVDAFAGDDQQVERLIARHLLQCHQHPDRDAVRALSARF